MTIEDGTYVPTTEEEISQLLEQYATEEDNFGDDIDLTPNSVFSSIFDTVAKTQTVVEEDIADVYDSAFLATAEGTELDRVVEITGVQRRDAQRATGYVEFSNQDELTQSYVIPKNTLVETASSEPTQYTTTEVRNLGPLETFEDNNIDAYSGDSSSFTTQSSTVYDRDISLESTATGTILLDDETIRRGDVVTVRQQNTDGGVLFCVQNSDEYYESKLTSNSLIINKYSGGTVVDSSSTSTSIPSNEWNYHEIDLDTQSVTVTVYNSNDVELGSTTLNDTDYFVGGHGFTADNSGIYYDLLTKNTVGSNIEAVEAGVEGNSSSNTLTVLPSPPNGVDFIQNSESIGDPELFDLNKNPQVQGQNKETDEQLRGRVRSTLTTSGVATTNAIISALVNEIRNVNSVSLFENKTNTTVDELPPYSFECVVLGGNDLDVAQTIFENKAVTAQDVGGVNGTETSVEVSAINNQTFTINFSRPTQLDVSIDISIVTTENYIGDDNLKDKIIEYIGGVDTSQTDIVGLGVGEDVYIDEIENVVVGIDETGVRGIDESNTTYTPTTTTNTNGLEIISVGDSEVATIDSDNISITKK